MNEYSNGSDSNGAAGELRRNLDDVAAEFSRNVQEAASKLGAAAEQFSSLTGRLASTADDVQAAAGRAQEAQRAAEAVQSRMEQDHSEVSSLVRDLQERIAALAVLARPLPAEATSTDAETLQPEAETPAAEGTPEWSRSW